jgi:transposase
MKLHQTTTKFNCGIDLHAQNMYACIMDQTGKKLLHQNIKGNDFKYFLKIAAPYVHDLTLACESTFNWYWLADACEAAGIKFVLGHVLYMRAIHGTKTKNDRVDSEKIAHLLRSNMLPEGYCCSPEKRPIRDLLRRRSVLVRHRTGILCHMSESVQAYGQEKLTRKEKQKSSRAEAVPERFVNPSLKFSMKIDTYMARQYDLVIKELEMEVIKQTRLLGSKEYALLKTTPGIGKTLGLVILYEVDDITRFTTSNNFCSYAMLTPADATSDSKKVGKQGRKMGNHYLKWAISELVVIAKRNPYIREYANQLEKKHGKFKTNAILRHRFGHVIFNMLKHNQVFSIDQFLKGKIDMKKIRNNGRCHKIDSRTEPSEDSRLSA